MADLSPPPSPPAEERPYHETHPADIHTERRLSTLEERTQHLAREAQISSINTKLGSISRDMVKKADLSDMKLWLLLTLGGLIIAGFSLSLVLIRIWITSTAP